MRGNTIGAAGPYSRYPVARYPIQVALVAGTELVRAGQGPAHRIEYIPLFHAGSRPDHALAAGIPGIGMVEAVVGAEFVRRPPWVKTVPQPHTGDADKAHSRPTPSRRCPKADKIKLVIRQNKSSSRSRRPGIRPQLI